MEIGTRLKEAREQKKLSLEDVQKITKIQTRYLQAIEKGNFDIMPGNFYVRAFIKEYATAVDLDPDQLMDEYKEELPVSTEDKTIQFSRVQRSRKESTSTKSPAIFSFLPTVIAILLIVGVAFTIWYFYQQSTDQPEQQVDVEKNNGDQVTLPPDQSSEDSNEKEMGQEQAKDSQVEESPTENEEPPATEPQITVTKQDNGQTTYDFISNSDDLRLVFQTTDKNWLEVENGLGKSFFYETLTKDNSPAEIDMSGEKQIYLRVGNPTTISIRLNEIEVKFPDDINPNEVQEVWINIKSETP
ncbi:helix-turn-helix domain-containing protein [Aquibacillus salsiterrae]|uniref:Helix-turn-helix domain-containing protein n=1 Tax=Aquibacillus salsiterrae TaxID=2950439 RepID=A0A9X4AE39_9BACI|nr:RodZ family helix-turn-helix domain-containing protein [Aquibacillus salsiterrae]MDC3416332.1 helix-turn-helix domain-containing protein [Aquibacillus salsiterrae]